VDILRRRAAEAPAQLRGAELQAFLEQLYDSTFDAVYALALASTGNHADAEDITAETYERAIRAIRSYRGDGAGINSWIYGIARNVVREQRRKHARTDELVDTYDVEGAASPAESVVAAMEAEQLLRHVTPAQREVLLLRMSGLKLREIAAALGKAEGTVKALQFQALQRLREVSGHE
jgi:RNA polymerase sigma-70 factor (ECF subfamily)